MTNCIYSLMPFLPDELIASIFVYIDSITLLQLLKTFPKIFGKIIRKYYQMFDFDFSYQNLQDDDLYYLRGCKSIDLSNCD